MSNKKTFRKISRKKIDRSRKYIIKRFRLEWLSQAKILSAIQRGVITCQQCGVMFFEISTSISEIFSVAIVGTKLFYRRTEIEGKKLHTYFNLDVV